MRSCRARLDVVPHLIATLRTQFRSLHGVKACDGCVLGRRHAVNVIPTSKEAKLPWTPLVIEAWSFTGSSLSF